MQTAPSTTRTFQLISMLTDIVAMQAFLVRADASTRVESGSGVGVACLMVRGLRQIHQALWAEECVELGIAPAGYSILSVGRRPGLSWTGPHWPIIPTGLVDDFSSNAILASRRAHDRTMDAPAVERRANFLNDLCPVPDAGNEHDLAVAAS
jgi:hypothetical protein